MDDISRTVIITGGNGGLGFECAKRIAQTWKVSHVVLACRNSEKTALAVQSLIKQTGNPHISSVELDLSSLESIRSFAKTVSSSGFAPIYALVCNAGVQIVNGTQFTQDGFEMTFGVNHLGHFLLANLLLGKMCDSGRVVFVSSDTHDPLKKTGMPAPVYEKAEFLAYPGKGGIVLTGTMRYTTSKLCNIYCTYELAERLRVDTVKGITVNAFNPGMMPGTGLARDRGPFSRFVWKNIMPVLTVFLKNVHTVRESGKALASLVTNPALDRITGEHFDGFRQIDSSALSYNTDNRLDLWRTSAQLVCLEPAETVSADS